MLAHPPPLEKTKKQKTKKQKAKSKKQKTKNKKTKKQNTKALGIRVENQGLLFHPSIEGFHEKSKLISVTLLTTRLTYGGHVHICHSFNVSSRNRQQFVFGLNRFGLFQTKPIKP